MACPPQALAKSSGLFCNDDKDAPAKEAQRENTLQQVSAGFFQVLASLYFTAGVRWILPGAGLAVLRLGGCIWIIYVAFPFAAWLGVSAGSKQPTQETTQHPQHNRNRKQTVQE